MMNEGYHMGEYRGATSVESATALLRRRRFRNDEGAVLIEFAIVIGLFFLLVFGMVDFGLAINTRTQITNAGREGARFGTVNLDPGAVEDRVREAGSNLDQDVLVVTVACQKPDDSPCTGASPDGDLRNGQSGDSVVVTTDYQYSLITPLPGFIDSDNKIDLQSITEMRIE
jgi:hypothetical protein